MPWDEWEQLKSDAAGRQATGQATGMRLNQLPGGPGSGGRDDLVVQQDDLGAVGHEAFVLHSDLGKQADIAGAGADKSGSGSSMQAAASLKSHNFTLGSALETTVSTWTSQVKSLLQACAHISNHLDYTKASHAKDDLAIEASIRNRDGSTLPVSRLDEYFK
ncbi:hypothetical protein ACFRKB_08615 [Streptomyces scopuliridis]|uniref:hypothetical protein n=1 Tax=Streptomyces scopuliridis TaxID=452529 RepID=UPI0036746A87